MQKNNDNKIIGKLYHKTHKYPFIEETNNCSDEKIGIPWKKSPKQNLGNLDEGGGKEL